jgi:hypothetical protein
MVEKTMKKQNKKLNKKTQNHSKSNKKQQLTLKEFNFSKITPQICNTNTNPVANNLDLYSFTQNQNESMNINVNYTQPGADTPPIIENSINGNQAETPLAISKLITEKTITHAKIQCAISNYNAQLKSITDYKNNPEITQIPAFLKLKIQNILKSQIPEMEIQQDIEKSLQNSFNFKQLKLLELENLNRNFTTNFWNETILPALQFANFAMSYEHFVSLYSTKLKNTKFEFFLVQQKHEIQKSEKLKKLEIIKEENMQQVALTKGDLNKLLKNFNQLSLKINNTQLENQKLKSKINSINSKKDPGRKALINNKKSIGQNKPTFSKRNGNKRNIVANKKYPSKISFS